MFNLTYPKCQDCKHYAGEMNGIRLCGRKVEKTLPDGYHLVFVENCDDERRVKWWMIFNESWYSLFTKCGRRGKYFTLKGKQK